MSFRNSSVVKKEAVDSTWPAPQTSFQRVKFPLSNRNLKRASERSYDKMIHFAEVAPCDFSYAVIRNWESNLGLVRFLLVKGSSCSSGFGIV